VAAIPIVAEAVGGDRGRTVRFRLDDGQVEIRLVGADAVVL